MRMIAFLLLLLNLGWLAWQQGLLPWEGAAGGAQVRSPFQQAPQRLQLLKELSPEQRALLDAIADSRQRTAETELRIAEAEQALDATRAQLETPPAPVSSPETQADPWCALVGPFADTVAVEGWLAGLPAVSGEGKIEVRDEPVSSTWWVHTPPFASEADARPLLDELQARGIDRYYIRTGELAGGISMGVFSRQESARTAQEQLARQGYRGEITQVFRTVPRHYADIRLADSTVLESPQWQEFEAVGAGLQVSEKLCEVIAREIQFP